MKAAVLGTGTMGQGMARSLRRSGVDVVAWNRHRDKAQPLEDDGIEVAGSVGEAVRDADVVVTMLFDADAVLSIAEELAGALRDDAVWLQSSTVGPGGMQRIAHAAPGAPLVDAPVLGTKAPAEKGALTVLTAGPSALVERARPVLEAIGSKTVDAGEQLGAASALKLAANAWIATITAGTAQSLALAEALGIDPGLFLEAIAGTPNDSAYAQTKGPAMLKGDYTPSFAVDGLAKDVGLMLSSLDGTDMSTSLLETLHGLYLAASEAGHGSDDVAAVRTAF